MNKHVSWPRIIIHGDMDAFYAAVEQRDNPSLVGKPVVVGGRSKRSVVSTASYEARKYGLHSAMPMTEALRRCPHVVVIPPDFERYNVASKQIMAVFSNYSPLVEPLSLDEAFVDMTGAEELFGPPEKMARDIKRDIYEATDGLTVSVGGAATKYVAKVASDFEKPDGLTLIPEPETLSFLWPLPVTQLWGVGPKSRKRIEQLGYRTIGDVAKAPESELVRHLGSLGTHIWQLANGKDDREVVSFRSAKSIGKELTLERDVIGASSIRPYLRQLAEQVARRLRAKELLAAGVRVKLKTASFKLLTHQQPLRPPVDSAKEMLVSAERLLEQFDLSQPMRLIGIAAFDLVESTGPVQAELFTDEAKERNRRLDRTLDQIQTRFGKVVTRDLKS
ncbi:MAG: DNA polymerase IV [Proteobacteria bacterium]|nr:DNA polymerase IV [Pseudomonadota bacterium]